MKGTRQKEEAPEQRPGPGDYYVVQCEYTTWYVSADTAARIGRVLDRRWPRPRWIKFVDLNGSRAWIRADRVESITECTALQRDRNRELDHLRLREERADRRWDEEEY